MKYEYYVNGRQVERAMFTRNLKSRCNKVVSTDVVDGWCGVDLMEFDKKIYDHYMRQIAKGTIVILGDRVFRRKEKNNEEDF